MCSAFWRGTMILKQSDSDVGQHQGSTVASSSPSRDAECFTDVMIPPPVGPTVRRVAYIIRIGLCPRIVQRTRLVSCGLVVTGRGLISYVPCCVSCVVSRRCLHTTESDSACLLGLY